MSALLFILKRQDERALLALVLRRQSLLDQLMGRVTHLGDATVVIGLMIALLLAPDPALREIGATVAFTLVVSHLGVQLLKRTVSRPRPCLPIGTASLIEAPDRFSFPSGHAAASLSLCLPLIGGLSAPFASSLLAIAVLVGISRCYLGVHYPGDVLAGWTLAALTSLAAAPALALFA